MAVVGVSVISHLLICFVPTNCFLLQPAVFLSNLLKLSVKTGTLHKTPPSASQVPTSVYAATAGLTPDQWMHIDARLLWPPDVAVLSLELLGNF